MLEKKHGSWIKPKVIFGFATILGFSVASLIITYKGFTDLNLTRRGLSEPGQKLVLINAIITEIYGEETDIRTYVLTGNPKHLESCASKQKKISASLKSLERLSAGNPRQRDRVEQIAKLLKRKREIVDELIHIRQGETPERFYDEALRKISHTGQTLQRIQGLRTVTTEITSERDTLLTQRKVERGLIGKIRSFFVGSEQVDTLASKIVVKTRQDTVPIDPGVPDSLIGSLVNILNRIRMEQQEYRISLSAKELELLESDRDVMGRIRSAVGVLEKDELSASLSQSLEIQEVVSKSIIKVLALGAITFTLLLLLLAIIFRDISRGNLYRQQLLEAKQYAEQLLKVKEQFLANMSHEIRTPLSAIIGIARQLKKIDLPPTPKGYVDTLSSSADHLLAVINDILDYSKLESGQLRLDSTRFEPRKLLADVVNFFAPKAAEKGLALLVNTDPQTPGELWGDTFRLRQIVMNLLSNAIKFTDSGSVIVSVSLGKQTEEFAKLSITVADTGVGIPQSRQALIFEEFTQADSSVVRRYGGTGLGLTIVKKLTELQGGEVSLQSSPQEGTTIRVIIPYRLTGTAESRPTLIGYRIPANTRVLVIDDDDVNRLIVVEMAKSLGLTADSLPSAEGLAERLQQTSYSAILTDIQMPGVSGYDVAKLVERLGVATPVIALTANSMVDSAEHFTARGFSGYLIKPFIEDDLFNTLAPLVGTERLPEAKAAARKTGRVAAAQLDLSDVYRFAGGDPVSLRIILTSFLDNTYGNIEDLSRHVRAREIEKASAVAHKMKSAFNQFKIYRIAGLLQRIEGLEPHKQRAAQAYVEELKRQVRPVLKELQAKIQSLQ